MKIRTEEYSRTNGLFIKAVPDLKSAKALRDLLVRSDPPFSIEWIEKSLHVSIMCSSTAPEEKSLPLTRLDISAKPYLATYWKGVSGTGFIVLLVTSSPFAQLHSKLRQTGLTHRYGIYIPHITVGMHVGEAGGRVFYWLEQINLLLPTLPGMKFNRLVVTDNIVPQNAESRKLDKSCKP